MEAKKKRIEELVEILNKASELVLEGTTSVQEMMIVSFDL